jgi:superoxide dismutase, Fe-Mn family
MTHKLPKLPYSYDALEPAIDALTMEIHHSKHHQGYVNKLNAALEGTGLENKEVNELLKDLNSVPENIWTAVRNNGGGHSNHSLFWEVLSPENKTCTGLIRARIDSAFGSLEECKARLKEAALGRFGSGWAWLVSNNGNLEVMSTPNQDSPLTEGKVPLLGIDVWEHGYYKKYGPDRAAYVDAVLAIINWDKVNELLEKS